MSGARHGVGIELADAPSTNSGSPTHDDDELRDVRAFVHPASVALVGASPKRPLPIENATRGAVHAVGVNPTRTDARGLTCVPTVADLDAVPDLAMLLVGHERVETAFEEAAAFGVRAMFVPGLGNEAGAEGQPIVARLSARADELGITIQGPNCMGVATPGGFSTWIGTLPNEFLPGQVGVVTQSGSIGEALTALGPRVGFSSLISTGGEAGVDVADFVAFLAADERTTTIGIFLETVRRPNALGAALERCAAAGKPVVCLKVGRSDSAARTALAHTGALVGSDSAADAFLRAHGVMRVDDLPDLVETLEVFGAGSLPRGNRLGSISESGGEAALLADHAESAGLRVEPLGQRLADQLRAEFPNFLTPGNPLDAWAIDEAEVVYPRSLELMARSGEFDILVAQVDLSRYRGAWERDWCLAIVEGLAAATAGTDIVAAVVTAHTSDPPDDVVAIARRHGIALLRGARPAARALAAAAAHAASPPTVTAMRGRARDTPQLRALTDGRSGALPEFESAALLEQVGVPFAPRLRADSPSDAGDAADRLGYPVVVKVDGPPHKAANGGVVLDVRSRAEAEAIARRLGGHVLVAHQAPPGLEAFCGVRRDSQFGPVLAVGLGGTAVESLTAPATALAPVDRDGARLLARAAGLGDYAELLAPIIVSVGRLAAAVDRIEEIDVNPIILSASTAVAVDALIVLEGSSA